MWKNYHCWNTTFIVQLYPENSGQEKRLEHFSDDLVGRYGETTEEFSDQFTFTWISYPHTPKDLVLLSYRLELTDPYDDSHDIYEADDIVIRAAVFALLWKGFIQAGIGETYDPCPHSDLDTCMVVNAEIYSGIDDSAPQVTKIAETAMMKTAIRYDWFDLTFDVATSEAALVKSEVDIAMY